MAFYKHNLALGHMVSRAIESGSNGPVGMDEDEHVRIAVGGGGGVITYVAI